MFEAFPAVVKAELERLKENQQWLAEKLDVSHVSVSNWLKGKRRPSAESVEAVARAFGRSASWLFEQMELATPSAVSADPDATEKDAAATWKAAWNAADEIPVAAAKVRPHPFAKDEVTRDLSVVDPVGEPCPNCGHKTTEAA